jgi:hypothetical protein
MPKKKIKAKDVPTLLDRAVAKKSSEYIYEKPERWDACVYFQEDHTPSCLIGFVLADLGVDPKIKMFASEGEFAHNMEQFGDDDLMSYLRKEFGLEFSDRAEELLELAQELQDEGTSWGNVAESIRVRAKIKDADTNG